MVLMTPYRYAKVNAAAGRAAAGFGLRLRLFALTKAHPAHRRGTSADPGSAGRRERYDL